MCDRGKRIAGRLIERGLVTKEQADKFLEFHEEEGKALGLVVLSALAISQEHGTEVTKRTFLSVIARRAVVDSVSETDFVEAARTAYRFETVGSEMFDRKEEK